MCKYFSYSHSTECIPCRKRETLLLTFILYSNQPLTSRLLNILGAFIFKTSQHNMSSKPVSFQFNQISRFQKEAAYQTFHFLVTGQEEFLSYILLFLRRIIQIPDAKARKHPRRYTNLVPGPPVEGSGAPGTFFTTIVELSSLSTTSEYVSESPFSLVSVTAPSDTLK